MPTSVAAARPEVVVHQMTALAATPDLRRFDRWFAITNELRTKGTDNLLYPMRDALAAYATLGEVSDVLRDEFGEYEPQAH